jgi:hypothetical protein
MGLDKIMSKVMDAANRPVVLPLTSQAFDTSISLESTFTSDMGLPVTAFIILPDIFSAMGNVTITFDIGKSIESEMNFVFR